MFNFALGRFTPPSFENIKWKTYLIFGVFGFCMALHAFLAFPETAGKTLEEVEDMFVAKIPRLEDQHRHEANLGLGTWRR
jgi:Sugar (and other) transporter